MRTFLSKYDLKFVSLKPGLHNYSYTVMPGFFSHFENNLIEKGHADVNVELFKQDDRLFTIDIGIEGELDLLCDRCLTEFKCPLSEKVKYILKIVNNKNEAGDEDDVFYATPDQDHINLSAAIFELIHLNIPIKKTCEMGGNACNEAMLKKIRKYESSDTENQTDPRWDTLKNLMTN